MAGDQPCNVTSDDSSPSGSFEGMHSFKKIRTTVTGLRKSPNKWTKEENQKLAALVSSYGEKKWKRISAEMGGQKTGAQCAQHWKRVLSPEIRKGHWDENEEELLLRLVVQYGSCWKKIAKKIPQRTDIQCRYQYLKAKQSREVPWDGREDESVIKKVMEVANCNFFPMQDSSPSPSSNSSNSSGSESSNNSPCSSAPIRGFTTGSPFRHVSSINTSSICIATDASNKENDSGLSSSCGSDSGDDDRMRFSGEFRRDAWNEDKRDVNMSSSPETSSWRSSGSEASSLSGICANCRRPVGNHINKVVWLEIAEHMARLKLTSTLRTALECKTRFNELLGNKYPFSNNSNYCNNIPEANGKHYDMKHSGDGMGGYGSGNGMDKNVPFGDIKINSHNKMNGNLQNGAPSINLNNCNNNNITINITNSYTTANANQNTINFQQIMSSSPTASTTPMKAERLPSHILSKSTIPSILSPAPPFPAFGHLSHPSFPAHLPQPTPMKPAFNQKSGGGALNVTSVPTNGLESLAAVASILPREMLADYAQY